MSLSVADLVIPSPLQLIHDPILEAAKVQLYLKREDLIHPDIPGNKWRKLKYNLEAARKAGAPTLLTFGGAYSNHLRAVAAAGKLFGFSTIGIVRGEPHSPLNWSLQYAHDHGMALHYIDRETYRQKHTPEFIAELHRKFGDFYLLPEGGSNDLAVKGCMEIPKEIDIDFDVICCSVGTGGTLAGIASGLKNSQRAIGFSSLKDGDFLRDDVAKLQHTAKIPHQDNWQLETNYHFGGFAKTTPELQEFINTFEQQHSIRLERTYVAKMLYGIFDQIKKGAFAPNTTIVAVITGPAEP